MQDGEVYTEEPMDVPGATVEIVETTVTPTSGHKHARKKGTPAYREQLLFRLVSFANVIDSMKLYKIKLYCLAQRNCTYSVVGMAAILIISVPQ